MSLYTLIPLLPLLASVILAVAGRRLGEASHKVAIPAIVASFAVSVAAFGEVLRGGAVSIPLYRFLQSGELTVDLGFYLDPLTVLLLLLVTGVSGIVHVYASRYMTGDPRYSRFFAVTALFTAAMAMLVMSRNLLMTYMCWEAMGICSYLLISHWAHRKAAGTAATRAFLVNAVADVGLGLGVILTYRTFGTLDIPQILERAESIRGQSINLAGWLGLNFPVETATVITLLLLTGALGKSAQVPFHVWLPFAMEAPTPVSALIHAATMVNAGPFLLVRFSPLLMVAPAAMAVIAVIGAVTALFAAVVSLTQTDIKKLLAYSTISQIGFMIMTCGLGAFAVAVFHLMAHGFLKGFLFLSTGSSLQAVADHHDQHAAASHAPPARLPWTVLAAALIFPCIPALILFSGPYEAMWTAHGMPGGRIAFWALSLATVILTAMYLFRGAVSQFQGGLAADGRVIQPRLFSLPHAGMVLAAGLGLSGIVLILWSWFTAFLVPGTTGAGGAQASARVLVALLAAATGWGLGYLFYARSRASRFAETGLGKRLYVLFLNKMYFDEIYAAWVVAPNLALARRLWNRVERPWIDGTLTLLATGTIAAAKWLMRVVEERVIDRIVHGSAPVFVGIARWMMRVLEGRVIDRVVHGSAPVFVGMARWSWRVLEGRGIDRTVEGVARQTGAMGRFLESREVHTLQEHLLLVVGGLAALLGLLYVLVTGG